MFWKYPYEDPTRKVADERKQQSLTESGIKQFGNSQNWIDIAQASPFIL